MGSKRQRGRKKRPSRSWGNSLTLLLFFGIRLTVFFSLFRKAVLGVPLILILPHLWGLGIYGVLAAEPVTNIAGGLACYLTMMAVVWKKL